MYSRISNNSWQLLTVWVSCGECCTPPALLLRTESWSSLAEPVTFHCCGIQCTSAEAGRLLAQSTPCLSKTRAQIFFFNLNFKIYYYFKIKKKKPFLCLYKVQLLRLLFFPSGPHGSSFSSPNFYFHYTT